jgi:hypothetical protein
MDIEKAIVKIVLKQKTSFLNKIKVFAKRKIRNGVINKQEAKPGNRNPEEHLEQHPGRPLEGEHSGILHTVWFVLNGMPH